MGETIIVPILVGCLTPIIVSYLTQRQNRQKANKATSTADEARSTAVSCQEELAVLKVKFDTLEYQNKVLREELKEMTLKWQEGRDVITAMIEGKLWGS